MVRYFHATLYQFGKAGQTAVLDKFRTAIQNVRVQCLYDHEDHMFCLECPASLGPEADQALSEAIDCCLRKHSDDEVLLSSLSYTIVLTISSIHRRQRDSPKASACHSQRSRMKRKTMMKQGTRQHSECDRP